MRMLLLLAVLLVLIASAPGPVAAQGPELMVIAPTDGAAIDATSVTVEFKTSNIKLVPTSVPVAEAGKHPEANRPGEGHVHFVLDLQPLVVWEKGAPYTFTGVPPGEHQLMVELVQNDHSPLSPPVARQIRFRTTGAQMLPRAGAAPSPNGAPVLLVLAILLMTAGGLMRRRRG